MMKRLSALLLALVLCLTCVAALAEENALVVDAPEGSGYAYEQLGIAIFVPDDLVQTEVSEEDAALGAFDMFRAEDGSKMIQFRISDPGADFDPQAYFDSLKGTEGVVDPEVGTINGISWITYSTTSNQMVAVTNVGELYLTAIAMPLDDEAFVQTFAQVLGSITSYTPAE